jgi:hypothetical protein
LGFGICLASALLASASIARAQRADTVETDPIRCWWKTDRNAVRVGERFRITLTCGVIDTPEVKVVPTLTQLDPGALQVPPFDVVGGKRGPDIVNPPRRYFQYEYNARLIAEGFFGQDVNIPPLQVTYNVESTTGQGSEGRDRVYVLPAMPMRILSLVPKDASDIRDAAPDSFADLDARRFRASASLTAAVVLFAFAALLVVVGVVRAFGGVRRRTPIHARPVAAGAVLAGCLRALKQVKAEVMRDGWTPALARRAQTAMRIAAAVALGRRLAQDTVASGVAEREGQIAITTGLIRRRRVLISASTTPPVIARELVAGNGGFADRAAIEQVQTALATFNAASYGRAGEVDRTTLDAALDGGTAAVRRLRVRSWWRPAMVLRREQWASS